MKNLIYLGFFILKTNYDDLGKSIKCTVAKGYSRSRLIIDMIYSSVKYGSSFVDYFNFNFYRKSAQERYAYASMGIMYRFHNTVNDKNFIEKVDDKKGFFINFSKYCNRAFLFSPNQKDAATAELIMRANKKIVIKDPSSTGGKGVQIVDVIHANNGIVIEDKPVSVFLDEHFKVNESLYFEDFIQQHDAVSQISPTGVNTIRMITLINNSGQIEIIGSVFRISVNCKIDNYSAGNLAAEIDTETGVVITGGIRKRSSCDKYHDIHPATGQQILGFTIPFWKEVKDIVVDAASVVPQVRSIGWDIAITNDGPVIIEGNSKWNKDTWQIPAGKGKLHMIEKYL